MKKKITVWQFVSQYGALCFLIALLAGNAVFTKNFISINIVWNLITQGFVTIVVSLGMMLVISSGGIDLSVGSVMPVAAMITAKNLDMGILPAIIMGLIAAILIGCFNGMIVAVFKIQPFIVTLAMYMAARGIAQLTNNSMVYNFTNETFNSLSRFRIAGKVPVQILIIPIFLIICFIIVKKSTIGRYIQAVGDNREASRLSGVNIVSTIIFTYGMCSALAGAAGIFEIARVGASDPNTLGLHVELDAIAAVVLGGTPMSGGKINLSGTVFAAIVMQLIVVTANMNNISAQIAYIVKAVVILVAVVIQRRESLKR